MAKQRPMLNNTDIKLLKTIFATKDDLKSFATKDDLREMEKRFRKTFATKTDLVALLTKLEFDDFKDDLDRKLTKQRSDLMDKLDKILGEVQASREEQTVLSKNVSGHEVQLQRVEQKLGIPAP